MQDDVSSFYAVILTFNLWLWTFLVYRLWRVKLCTKFEWIEQSAAKLLRFEYLTLWPWTRVACSAMLWDNFHKVETWSVMIFMLIRYVTLWPYIWPVDLDTCITSGVTYVVKVCTKHERNRTIPGWVIDNLATFCPVTLRRDLDLWPLDLERLQ